MGDSESESEDRATKRQRIVGGGFSNSGGGGFGGPETSAEDELQAMLAAESKAAAGMPPGQGAISSAGAGAMTADGSRVETTPMDFSRLARVDLPSRDMPVPKELVEPLMTPEHRQILAEESGADVEWAPEEAVVKLRGSAEQTRRAIRLLQRVVMHCHWGRSESKVRRLLKPKIIESTICRLSPMNTLRPAQKTLNTMSPVMSIGKDKTCDVVIRDPIISRQHCAMELDPERGAVYAIDCSTNGTFLNGIRLPSKKVGKVLLSHGDELLFKDPASGEQEFGYIVNLQDLQVREETRLEPPRRLLTPEEQSTSRDL